jgi:cbb3-type cytochrome oxidase subunit 3
VEWVRARHAGAAVLAGVAIAALLVLVALASRPPDGSGLPLLGADPAQVVLDVTVYLLAILALFTLLLIVWAFWPRRDEAPPKLPPRRRPFTTIVTMLLLAVAVIVLRGRGQLRIPGLDPGGAGVARPLQAVAPNGQRASTGGGGVDWVAIGIVTAVVLLAAFLIWRALRKPARSRRASALAGLEELLDDAIEDVLREADPRRAVIAAWARLERVLARHGVPRRASEAPLEYAARATAELDLAAVSLERLADLYEWARFSLNEVTPAMRQEALDGLLDVRDGLRSAA